MAVSAIEGGWQRGGPEHGSAQSVPAQFDDLGGHRRRAGGAGGRHRMELVFPGHAYFITRCSVPTKVGNAAWYRDRRL